jgi:hypothetical protein
MLFPLGTYCKVKESIQRYLNNDSLETNIFDWKNINSITFNFLFFKFINLKNF